MKVFSTWGSIQLWETRFERALRQRYSLRTHGLLIGSLTLLLTWGISTTLMHAGVDGLALRYLLSLGAGYLAYLLMLRGWAHLLVRRVEERSRGEHHLDAPGGDWHPDASPAGSGVSRVAELPPLRSGGGGDFAGGGASGDFAPADAGDTGLSELAGEALGAAASADEGAVVVVPVVAVFLAGLAMLLGAGSLVLLFFGFDALLAVAMELAFAYASARAAAGLAREGWLSAAARLTWKPLLGALLCAVVLGGLVDHFMPQANSMPEVVRMLAQR